MYCTWLPAHALVGPAIDAVVGAAELSAKTIEFDTVEGPHEFTPYAVYVPSSPADAEAIVSVALVSPSSVAPRYHWKLVAFADVAVYCTWLPGQAVAGPAIEAAPGAGLTTTSVVPAAEVQPLTVIVTE